MCDFLPPREAVTTAPALPGAIEVDVGTVADYVALARHHYRTRRPATIAAIRVARHAPPDGGPPRAVGVAVLSWPVPMLRARIRHFALPPGYGVRLRFANANVRTVSRVIVHPQFRALGVASRLVGALVDACPTRYVESSAQMARYATFLARAGFVERASRDDEPAYFLLDRATPQAGRATHQADRCAVGSRDRFHANASDRTAVGLNDMFPDGGRP